MFEQLIESSKFGIPSRRPLTFGLAMILHITAIGVLISATPLFPETLPSPLRSLPTLLAPILPPPPPPKGTQRQLVKSPRSITTTQNLITPKSVPTGTIRIVDPPRLPLDEPDGMPWGVEGGIEGGTRNGILSDILARDGSSSQVPPPRAPAHERQSAQPVLRVLVGGEIQKANLIYQVKPVYPALARQTRTQGAVILGAVISPEGNVEDLHVISGHPFLVNAAVEAVMQWRYRPTLLNGRPTRVDTTITVNFSLGN